jgi:hypothetical protein
MRNIYISASYDLVKSTLREGFNYYVNVFGLIYITKSLYGTVNYSYGLNREAVDHSFSFKFGVKF